MKHYSQQLAVGAFFLCGGAVSATGGILALTRFVRENAGREDFSVGQLARGMIVPHIFAFLGVGIAVYGIIWLVQGLRLRRRVRHAAA